MAPTKPNVIMIMTDDQGFGDLGCHGNPVALTPNLDKLHDESTRLNDFHVAPMCTPTRGQLLTGMDGVRNGAVNVSSGRTLLRADLDTMADAFKAGGYRTGIFGKWHLGDNYPYRPQDRGFEETLWFPSSHISSLPDYWENDYFDDVYMRNGKRERMEGYCTEVFFAEAKSWMKQRIDNQESFFTYLPTNAPHYPLWVPKADRETLEVYFAENEEKLGDYDKERRGELVRFLAMIYNLDRQIGLLRDFLEEEGIADNTILMFMTDNGSTFGPIYYNAGMKGGKVTLWEGGHRVPCFINGPEDIVGEPRDIEGLTQAQDILPTLMDICGLTRPEQHADGASLAPVLAGTSEVPDRIIPINYSRMPNFDYPMPDNRAIMRREGAAVLWQRWRLLEGTALYNLDVDPMQETNVIEQHPDVATKLTEALDTWWDEVKETANEAQRVIIGHDAENPTTLTGCEWWDVFLDQHNQVRRGVHKNSYWHLNVAKAGTYKFELRRWPIEADLELAGPCPESNFVDGCREAGVALPIAHARIRVGGENQRIPVNETDKSAVFTVELDAGDTYLSTWFLDERIEPITGAYYVYVERL